MNKTDLFLLTKGQYFSGFEVPYIKNHLESLDDDRWTKLLGANFHNPSMMLIVSFLGGPLGIDRFLIGDTGLGVGKLLTCGGFGIWAIIDLFLIMDASKRKNIDKFNMIAV